MPVVPWTSSKGSDDQVVFVQVELERMILPKDLGNFLPHDLIASPAHIQAHNWRHLNNPVLLRFDNCRLTANFDFAVFAAISVGAFIPFATRTNSSLRPGERSAFRTLLISVRSSFPESTLTSRQLVVPRAAESDSWFYFQHAEI